MKAKLGKKYWTYSKKGTKNSDIPVKILKRSVDIYIKEITFIINDCIKNGMFPDDLKLANVSTNN